MNTPTLYQLLPGQPPAPLALPDMSSLDAITRQLPDGLYTTFRTYGGRARVIGLRAHLARLYEPCAGLGITPVLPVDVLRRMLAVLLAGYPAEEARVRLVLTVRGDPDALYAALEPLQPPVRSVYEHGVRVATVAQLGRENPALKRTAFISASQGERTHLAQEHIYEGLLVRNGRILEGMTSNFFYVSSSGEVGTAGRNVLMGVTRSLVIVAARKAGLSVCYRALAVKQVTGIREAFITSSSRGVVPVVSVDDVQIGGGSPGPITRDLIRQYEALAVRRAEVI